MSSPALNDPFNVFYDAYSISHLDFAIPDHFNLYAPDFKNDLDFACLSVIAPDPIKGAQRWTVNGRWMTIGVYRDEGRASAQRPPTTALSWTRVGSTLTMVDPAGHRLRTADKVNLYNVNFPQVLELPITVLNSTTFTVRAPIYGATSGVDGAYQPSDDYNFYELNYVFRLLPSFKLVPYSTIAQLFTDSAPPSDPQLREMYNVTTASTVQLPRGKSRSSNYDVPRQLRPVIDQMPLARRFGQVYDETGTPLKLHYRDDGQALPPDNYDEVRLNAQERLQQPLVNEVTPGDDSTADTRVYAYDFYGIDVNDPTRGPYFRSDIVARDPSIDGVHSNFLRAGVNSTPYYAGKIYDGYGNLALGIQESNALVTRENLLPLKLNNFNRPIKAPIRHYGKLQGT